MTQSTKTISPLRQRMIDDMTLRKLGPRSQTAYIRAVKNFTRFFGQSPDAAQRRPLGWDWRLATRVLDYLYYP